MQTSSASGGLDNNTSNNNDDDISPPNSIHTPSSTSSYSNYVFTPGNRRDSVLSAANSILTFEAIPEGEERSDASTTSSTEVMDDRLNTSERSIGDLNELALGDSTHIKTDDLLLEDSPLARSSHTISDKDAALSAAQFMEKLERSQSSCTVRMSNVRGEGNKKTVCLGGVASVATSTSSNIGIGTRPSASLTSSNSFKFKPKGEIPLDSASDHANASALRAHRHTRRHHHHNHHGQKRLSMSQRMSQVGTGAYRRLSRYSMIIQEAGAESLRAVPETMEKYLDPDEIEDEDFDYILIGFFGTLQLVFFGFIVSFFSFPTLMVTCPTLIGSVVSMAALTKTIDKTTRGERIVNIIGLTIILVMATLFLMLATSSCTHCVFHWAEDAMASSQDFSGMDNGKGFLDRSGVAWDLLLSRDDTDADVGHQQKAKFTAACRKCVSSVFVLFLDDWNPTHWIPFWNSNKPDQASVDKALKAEIAAEEEAMFQLQPYQHADSMFGDLAAWYLHYANKTVASNLKAFNQKFANALSVDGHFTDHEIADVMEAFLCSPASRVDNPDPNKFLADIKIPRFTGEQGLNISTAALQRIMRGDILQEIGVALCFVLRFALFVPEDHELEKKAISFTQLFPSMNEKGMRTHDYTTTLYFFTSPGFDQDIDVDSGNMKVLESLIDIFTRFDFQDNPIYFQTKEEYYAFYRWELENTIQDDWYFPRWFLETEKYADLADFMADKLKYSNDYAAFQDPTSDRTLGDRVFFGPGSKFLTQIKLPGINDDFEYLHPGRPERYMTDEHREAFRYPVKPTPEVLLDMIYKFWPKEAKRAEKRRRWGDAGLPLARFKDKIAEIDLSVFAKLETRDSFFAPGCILYLDPKSMLPMGIWESSRKRMFLPGEKDWDHAKYFYRVTERVVVATFHVFESHFTWSQPFATAAWQCLPENHGLRILTKPYTLHTHSVNWAAYHMLGRNHSILNHASGYTQDGYTEFFMILHKDLNFSRTIPIAMEESKLANVMDTRKVPYHSQALKLWKVHREFVESFVKVLYPSDEAMLKDDAVVRFWHHTNTYGRHMDPCVCGLDSDLFFDDTAWPGFETTRTCMELLDLVKYAKGKHDVTRRRNWCTKEEPFTRVKAVRLSLQIKCNLDPACSHLPYTLHYMRADMGLTALQTRGQLIDYITTVIWHSTAGHNINSDNIPSFSDPDFSGVRMREFGPGEGELMRRIDVGAYIFGITIASLTSLRAPPLLADWTPLYSNWATKQPHLSGHERKHLLETLEEIHKTYKFSLLDLGREFLAENLKRPVNRRWNSMNPATQGSSVAV